MQRLVAPARPRLPCRVSRLGLITQTIMQDQTTSKNHTRIQGLVGKRKIHRTGTLVLGWLGSNRDPASSPFCAPDVTPFDDIGTWRGTATRDRETEAEG